MGRNALNFAAYKNKRYLTLHIYLSLSARKSFLQVPFTFRIESVAVFDIVPRYDGSLNFLFRWRIGINPYLRVSKGRRPTSGRLGRTPRFRPNFRREIGPTPGVSGDRYAKNRMRTGSTRTGKERGLRPRDSRPSRRPSSRRPTHRLRPSSTVSSRDSDITFRNFSLDIITICC